LQDKLIRLILVLWKKNKKIRIAVVGCGRISKNHFGSIEQLDTEFELVAVCDSQPYFLKNT